MFYLEGREIFLSYNRVSPPWISGNSHRSSIKAMRSCPWPVPPLRDSLRIFNPWSSLKVQTLFSVSDTYQVKPVPGIESCSFGVQKVKERKVKSLGQISEWGLANPIHFKVMGRQLVRVRWLIIDWNRQPVIIIIHTIIQYSLSAANRYIIAPCMTYHPYTHTTGGFSAKVIVQSVGNCT